MARARQPHANANKPTPKDAGRAAEETKQGPSKDQRTGRAAEDTKPGPPKDQRPGAPKRANFTGRPVLASDLSEMAYTRVLQLGNCFK